MSKTYSKKTRKRLQKSWMVLLLMLLIFSSGIELAVSQDESYLEDDALVVQLIAEQNKSGKQLMSIQFTNVSLQEALEILAEKINVGFSYNPEIMPDKKVTLGMTNVPVYTVLYKLLEGTNLEPVLPPSKDVIVIRKKEEQINPSFLQETITGTVVDAQSGEALPGVNVIVSGSEEVTGSTIGTTTNMDGYFEVQIPEELTTLVFTYVGYQRLEVDIDDRTEINVQLQPDTQMLDDIIVVGYGTQERINLTGSVTQVGGADLQEQPSILPSAALMGKAAGVTVIQESGRPGANSGTIRIRGIGTLSNTNALVLIDGVEGNIDDVSSADIEDISILKDAASASIYGSRAANGVILITTKRGKSADLQVNYRSLYGWNKATRQPEYVDAGTFMRLENEGSTNLGQQPIWSEAFIQEWEQNHKTDPNNYPNTDWVNEVFSGSGFQQTQHISVSGGRDNLRFLGSINYDQELGTIPNFGFDRYSLRLNTDVSVSDRLNLDFDLNATRLDTKRPSWTMSALARQAYRIPPIYAARYTDGSYGPGWDGGNPLARAEVGGIRTDEEYVIRGRISAKFEPVDGLAFNLLYSPLYENGFFKRMLKQYHIHDPETGERLHTDPNQNELRQGYDRNFTNNLNFTTNYLSDLGDHTIQVLGGYELIDYQRDIFEAYRDDFILQDFEELNAASSANQQNSGRSTSYSLQSFFGRFNYNYRSKYLFEANLRYDGSSRFAEEVRWGLFPSFSAGWNISEEDFLRSVNLISELKLRASWGKLGNQNIGGNFPYAATINLNQEFLFGGSPVIGAAQLSLANPNLTWEETTSFNIGTDLVLLDDRIFASFDWFKRTTDDILLQLPIPNIIGMSAPYQNAGKVENTGWEIEAGYRGHIGRDFSFSTSFNLSDVQNEVLDLKDTGPFISGNSIIEEGSPINSIYGYVSDGLFQTQDEIDNHASQFGQVAPGDIKYKDINGDGVINADDRVIIGDPFPRLTFGINLDISYKNFDLSALFQGIGKRDILLTNEAVWAFYNAGKITKWQAEDYWSPDNPDASYPRLTQTGASHNNFRASDKWVYDASYLRLRNLQIGYTLPVSWTNQFSIRNARIFFNGQNLFTLFDNLPQGVDPNVPNSTAGSYYPVNRLLAGGVEINF